MKHLILLFLTMTLTGCGLETIASMPIEPENTAESSPEAEERPLAPVDEIMATKGVEEPQRAVESEEENETQDEPEVVAEEEAAGEVVEEAELPESGVETDDGEGNSNLDETDVGELEESSDPVAESVNAEPPMHLWGVCTITWYCNCSQCTGQWAGGPTASGVMPTPNHTVACGDLPFGTRLMIDGQEYVVEDTGVNGMWVDIFCSSHDEAVQRGMYQSEVYIID